MMEREIGGYYVAVFEDGKRGQEPRNVGSLQRLEKARKWVFS